jgi:hypothetical protein
VVGRRWFGAKSRDVSHARILEAPVLRDGDPTLALAIVEIAFDTGTHDCTSSRSGSGRTPGSRT